MLVFTVNQAMVCSPNIVKSEIADFFYKVQGRKRMTRAKSQILSSFLHISRNSKVDRVGLLMFNVDVLAGELRYA